MNSHAPRPHGDPDGHPDRGGNAGHAQHGQHAHHGHGEGSSHTSHSAEMPDPETMLSKEYWDGRYNEAPKIWSGNPNVRLVEYVSDLPPGRALDVGCGEGADAVWLAARGWEVTAIDISQVALDRGAAAARHRGNDVADRIRWQQADVFTVEPGVAQYDLVSAQFLHLPATSRDDIHRRLAAAVRPGGMLLVVAHAVSDLDAGVGRWRVPEMFFTADEVVAVLEPGRWRVEIADALERSVDVDGRPVAIHDTVARAVRLS